MFKEPQSLVEVFDLVNDRTKLLDAADALDRRGADFDDVVVRLRTVAIQMGTALREGWYGSR